MAQSFGVLTGLSQQVTQIDVGVGVVGPVADRLGESGDGAGAVFLLEPAVAQVVVGEGVAGLESDGFFKGLGSRGVPLLRVQGAAKVEVRFHRTGVTRQRLAEGGLGTARGVRAPAPLAEEGQHTLAFFGGVAELLEKGEGLRGAVLVEQLVGQRQLALNADRQAFHLLHEGIRPRWIVGGLSGPAEILGRRLGIARALMNLGAKDEAGFAAERRGQDDGEMLLRLRQLIAATRDSRQAEAGAWVVRRASQHLAKMRFRFLNAAELEQNLREPQTRHVDRGGPRLPVEDWPAR